MSDWIVKKAKAWDRCWPGNMNVEILVDDMTAEIERLQAELREARELMQRTREWFRSQDLDGGCIDTAMNAFLAKSQ